MAQQPLTGADHEDSGHVSDSSQHVSALAGAVFVPKKGYNTKTVSRYLKQTVSYFYTQIRQTAVKTFVDGVFNHSNHEMGKLYKAPNAKRAHVVLTEENALALLGGNTLLDDVAPWAAFLDALVAVFDRVGAGPTFSEVNPTSPQKPRPVCLLAHIALVMVKIIEHLKRVAGVTEEDSPGMNAGHRDLWVELLVNLHDKFRLVSEPQRGLRLRDVDPTTRATVDTEDDSDDADSDFDDMDAGNDEEAAAGEPAADVQ